MATGSTIRGGSGGWVSKRELGMERYAFSDMVHSGETRGLSGVFGAMAVSPEWAEEVTPPPPRPESSAMQTMKSLAAMVASKLSAGDGGPVHYLDWSLWSWMTGHASMSIDRAMDPEFPTSRRLFMQRLKGVVRLATGNEWCDTDFRGRVVELADMAAMPQECLVLVCGLLRGVAPCDDGAALLRGVCRRHALFPLDEVRSAAINGGIQPDLFETVFAPEMAMLRP